MLFQFQILIHSARVNLFSAFNLFVVLIIIISTNHNCFGQVQRLTNHNIEKETISVSGLSSGAFYSVQLSFILSSQIRGVGVFSGGPYPLPFILSRGGEKFNIAKLKDYIAVVGEFEKSGKIDDTSNLRKTKAFVFRGSQDIVPEFTTDLLLAEYRHYGVDVKNMTKTHAAFHCIPTDNYGYPCSSAVHLTLQISGTCNCGYQGVSEMFKHFYGTSYINVNSTDGYTGNLFKFNQNEFFTNNDAAAYAMNDWGYAYVPTACAQTMDSIAKGVKCKLHFVLHGCFHNELQRLLDWPFELVENTGYLQAADANNIIVIFPQLLTYNPTIHAYTAIPNPNACWDWYFGYTGCDFRK